MQYSGQEFTLWEFGNRLIVRVVDVEWLCGEQIKELERLFKRDMIDLDINGVDARIIVQGMDNLVVHFTIYVKFGNIRASGSTGGIITNLFKDLKKSFDYVRSTAFEIAGKTGAIEMSCGCSEEFSDVDFADEDDETEEDTHKEEDPIDFNSFDIDQMIRDVEAYNKKSGK